MGAGLSDKGQCLLAQGHTQLRRRRQREDIYSKSSLLWPAPGSHRVTVDWLSVSPLKRTRQCSGWAKTKRLFAIAHVDVAVCERGGEWAVVVTTALAGATSQVRHLAPPTVSNGLGACVAGQTFWQ